MRGGENVIFLHIILRLNMWVDYIEIYSPNAFIFDYIIDHCMPDLPINDCNAYQISILCHR